MQPATAHPMVLGSGNKVLVETDYAGSGSSTLNVVRTYNSAPSNRAKYDLAPQWSIGIYRALTFNSPSSPTLAIVVRPDGKALRFTLSGGVWVPAADISDSLTQLTSGAITGWRYRVAADNAIEDYDASGLLLQITSGNGLRQQFSFSDGSGGILYGTTPQANGYLAPACNRPSGFSVPSTAGVLLCVSDTQGRQLNFSYDSSGRLNQFADPLGQITSYTFDANNNLGTVTYPDSAIKTYLYENSSFPNALTGITDENGIRYATYGYDSQGRAYTETLSGGADAATLAFGTNTTTVTDAIGTARTYNFSTILGVQKRTGSNQPGGSGCGAASSALSYDANGNVSSQTDFNGNVTTYTYDNTGRNLETQRVEASGTTVARTISTQWHSYWRLPVKVAEPLKLTTYTYNGDGGVYCAPTTATVPSPAGTQPIGVLCSRTEQVTTDADGSAGLTPTVTGTPRTWTWTYNSVGQVLTADGPRTDVADVTTYTYYAANDATVGKRGNLATITNALGRVTSITDYDANGRPLTIVDPNSVTTTLSYDPRGRLTSRDVAGETTTYDYDSVGQLTRITPPDGSFISYTWDAAHRLTDIHDGIGDSIHYTLDALGNRTREEVRDSANQLAQLRQRTIDALNRLYQDIGASSQTTTYTYDANGNRTGASDPLSHGTTNAYDALNRLIAITDPASGQTHLTWNGQDRATQITDPRSLATAYTVDGLGNLTQQTSPDSGTTTYTYDAAGNLLTRTDAKGQVNTYYHDALNRLRTIVFPDGTARHEYGYDAGWDYGLGRLTTLRSWDAQNQQTWYTAYRRDQWGRIFGESAQVNGVMYGADYVYDAAGHLITQGYPAGNVMGQPPVQRRAGLLTYNYDGAGRITQILSSDSWEQAYWGGTPIVSNVVYHPSGQVQSFTYGNGQTYTRSYDLDGRISSYTLGATTYSVGYDAASRITSVTGVSYGYDSLDRLVQAVLPLTTIAYAYDVNGNRTSAGGNSYAYSGASNRLTLAAGQSVQADANGSIVSDGVHQLAYDAQGRLRQVTTAQGTTTYLINPLGRRIRKTGPGIDTVFHYDPDGRLIAESDASGAARREYIYLGDLPVAVVVIPPAGARTIYYIHADHLNTPRLIADQNQTTVWRNLPTTEPFGNSAPEEDPSGLGTFTFNLRFAGQYFDKESGLFYNWHRYYDPLLGRYLSPDPIGLAGGRNPFLYAGANPLSRIDPTGLDWIYQQSTGNLYNTPIGGMGPPYLVSPGGPGQYAGHDEGLNNPAYQNVQGTGPLPQGTYTIGPQQTNVTGAGTRLPASMRLVPDPLNEMFDRAGFLIHGDNSSGDQSASEGCPIVPRNIRNRIGNSGDPVLRVVR